MGRAFDWLYSYHVQFSPHGEYMAEETQNPLTSFSTASLVEELRKRFTEVQEAQAALNLGTKPMATVSFQRQPHKNKNKMRNAAVQRWEGWDRYKATHGPNASRKAFFKAKREGKI